MTYKEVDCMSLIKRERSEVPVTVFDPFDWLARFEEEWPLRALAEHGRWTPPLEVSETDVEYKIRVEAPGMSKEDIKVEIEGDTLTISGEKRQTKETKDEKLHVVETRYGSFARRLRFEGIDAEKVKATSRDGVLDIVIPKSAKARAKKVEIG